MAWAVRNARVVPLGNAIAVTKQASGTAKIDALMAALNAVAWMSRGAWDSTNASLAVSPARTNDCFPGAALWYCRWISNALSGGTDRAESSSHRDA